MGVVAARDWSYFASCMLLRLIAFHSAQKAGNIVSHIAELSAEFLDHRGSTSVVDTRQPDRWGTASLHRTVPGRSRVENFRAHASQSLGLPPLRFDNW